MMDELEQLKSIYCMCCKINDFGTAGRALNAICQKEIELAASGHKISFTL